MQHFVHGLYTNYDKSHLPLYFYGFSFVSWVGQERVSDRSSTKAIQGYYTHESRPLHLTTLIAVCTYKNSRDIKSKQVKLSREKYEPFERCLRFQKC